MFFAAAFVSLMSSPACSYNAGSSDDVVWMTAGLDASSQRETDQISQALIPGNYFIHSRFAGEPWVLFEWSWNLDGGLDDSVSDRVAQTQAHLDQLYRVLDVASGSTHEASAEVVAETRARVSELDIDGDRRFDLRVKIRNGREVIDVPEASIRDGVVTWGFPHHDSRIEIDRSEDGVLRGVWHKVRDDTVHQMDFMSLQDHRVYFGGGPIAQPVSRVFGYVDTAACDVRSTRWKVEFEQSEASVVEFDAYLPQSESQDPGRPFQAFTSYSWLLRGTIRTPAGGLRYLAGEMRGVRDNFCGVGSYQPIGYQLSAFDGEHALLLRANSTEDGSIEGEFWSGNWHHETLTAEWVEP